MLAAMLRTSLGLEQRQVGLMMVLRSRSLTRLALSGITIGVGIDLGYTATAVRNTFTSCRCSHVSVCLDCG